MSECCVSGCYKSLLGDGDSVMRVKDEQGLKLGGDGETSIPKERFGCARRIDAGEELSKGVK